MMVECFCGCRNKIEQSCAYKIVLGGTRKVYFLNEQHYLRWQDRNSAKSNKIDEKEFAAGSMLPKIEACMSFVKDHPDREAIITSLSGLKDALAGKLGTVIVDG